MTITGPYGRQWISPKASSAFNTALIQADECCFKGQMHMAIQLYNQEARNNSIAKRRLNIAKKQIKKSLSCKKSNCQNTLNIGFIDWYPGFNKDIDFVISLFSRVGLQPIATTAENADILVAGAYGNDLVNNKSISDDKLIIFLTGENLCPSYDIHDFSISTRNRSFCGKNIRLPQWLGDLCFDSHQIKLKPCRADKNSKSVSRDLFVSAIYNNATPEREELVYRLRTEFGHENIHVYGSHRNGEVDKFQILARTVINLCFENSLGEGYVTEKLLHARAMGCKALYWGDSSFLEDFRSDGILNIRDTSSIQDVLDWCHIQRHAPTPAKLNLGDVDPQIFAKSPMRVSGLSRLTEWASIILGWRGL